MEWSDKREFWAVDLGFLMSRTAHLAPSGAVRSFEAAAQHHPAGPMRSEIADALRPRVTQLGAVGPHPWGQPPLIRPPVGPTVSGGEHIRIEVDLHGHGRT